jgi:peptidoglycan/LPS O-acetylase OafA/YrhL
MPAPDKTRLGTSIVGLDLLRGLAALEVLLYHVRTESFVDYGALPASQHNWIVAAFFALTRMGDEAVIVFFALSGFLVGGQIIRHIQDARFDPASYAIDRVTRIFIPLIPACLLTAGVYWLWQGNLPPVLDVLANMTGLNGIAAPTLPLNAPLWTLAYEIWFYIVGGSIGCLLTARAKYVSVAVLVVAFYVFSVFLKANYLLFWALGASSALLVGRAGGKALFWAGLASLASGVASYQLGLQSKSMAAVAFIPQAASGLLICAGIAMMIPLICDRSFNARLGFLHRPAAYIAAISYTLYLFHGPIFGAVLLFLPIASGPAPSLGGVFLARFAAVLAIILVCVNIFYWCFEARTYSVRLRLRGLVTKSI